MMQPAAPLRSPPPLLGKARPVVAKAKAMAFDAVADMKSTRWGKWLAVICLAIMLSAFRDWRIEVAGLLMHPHLLLTGLVFIIALFAEIGSFPDDFVRALSGFFVCFLFSTLPEYGGSDQILKVGSAMVTIVLAAFCVRNEADYRLVVMALVTSIVPIAIKGISSSEYEAIQGINPLEGISNKNGFSVYALPAILMGGHFFLDPRHGKFARGYVGLGVLITVFAIFQSGNRSGWLAVAIVFLSFLGIPRRRLRGFTWVALAAGAIVYVILNYGNNLVIENRIEVTRSGYLSDEFRRQLFYNAMNIGFEHPIFGVSPQRLPFELAHRLRFHMNAVDPHNVFGFLFGGSGGVTMAFVIYAGWVMYAKQRSKPAAIYGDAGVQNALYIIRGLVWIWCIRGMFSREILYNPCFCIALGACFSYRRNNEQRAHIEHVQREAGNQPEPVEAPVVAPAPAKLPLAIPVR